MQGNPKMESVKSSHLREIGYDPVERTLYVKFKSGAEYRYREVPPTVFEALRSAPSAGKYFAKQISGVYPVRR